VDKETKQAYTEIDVLLPYQRYAATLQRGIDPLRYAAYRKKTRSRESKPRYDRKCDNQSRRDRLRQQGGNCALCETPLLDHGDVCYEPSRDVVTCNPCQIATSLIKSVMRRGVTLPMLVEWVKGFEDINQSSTRYS
jgi:hypothetical protein